MLYFKSSQRICDSCAQRREVEVLIGNRFHQGNKSNNRISCPTTEQDQAGVIMILIKSMTGLGIDSTWGNDEKSSSFSKSLSCSISVGGKSLGQTTTKLWNLNESKGAFFSFFSIYLSFCSFFQNS